MLAMAPRLTTTLAATSAPTAIEVVIGDASVRISGSQIGACQYRHVRDILTNNRDQNAPATTSEWVSPGHAHVRGPGYYQ